MYLNLWCSIVTFNVLELLILNAKFQLTWPNIIIWAHDSNFVHKFCLEVIYLDKTFNKYLLIKPSLFYLVVCVSSVNIFTVCGHGVVTSEVNRYERFSYNLNDHITRKNVLLQKLFWKTIQTCSTYWIWKFI